MLILYMSFIDDDKHHLFNKIYETYRKQMFVVARSVLENDEDSEDAVHDAFLRIAKNQMPLIQKIQDEVDLRNYLLKSAKNAALDRLHRRNNTKAAYEAEYEYMLSTRQNMSDNEFVDRLCNEIEYNRVVKAISMLNPACRDAMYYHFVLEFSIPEIARLLNCKPSAAKQRLVRGKKLLMELLSPGGK